jgi:hypothetical protein
MRIRAFFSLVLSAAFALAALSAKPAMAVPQLDSTYWNSNWQAMFFQNEGSKVEGEYIHDQGVLTGTLHGDTLTGWWREYNNDQTCGPEGRWSGKILFLFAADGKSFTGSWNYCTDSASLDPDGNGWVGTQRDSGYNQSECQAAGRYWCDNQCRLSACGESLTKVQCEAVGRFWCDDACSLAQCSAGIRPVVRGRSRVPGQSLWEGAAVDAQGRSLDPAALRRGWMIFAR